MFTFHFSEYKSDNGLQKLDSSNQNDYYNSVQNPLQSSQLPIMKAPQDVPPKHFVHPTRPFSSSESNLDTDSLCQKFCGQGSICKLIHGRPVCGCPEGHTGDPAKHCVPIKDPSMPSSSTGTAECTKHIDCQQSHICFREQCINPCQDLTETGPEVVSSHQVNGSMCGSHAKCVVIQHTPLCACEEGFYGNPYVGCSA